MPLHSLSRLPSSWLSLCLQSACVSHCVWGGRGVMSASVSSLSLPAPVSLSLTCCCSVSPVPAPPTQHPEAPRLGPAVPLTPCLTSGPSSAPAKPDLPWTPVSGQHPRFLRVPRGFPRRGREPGILRSWPSAFLRVGGRVLLREPRALVWEGDGVRLRSMKVGEGRLASLFPLPRLCPSTLRPGVCPRPLCGTQSVPVCTSLARGRLLQW